MKTKVDQITRQYSAHSSDLVDAVHSLYQTVKWIETFAPQYDYDETIQFNGFRSFVKIIDRLFGLLLKKSPSNSWLINVCLNEKRDIEDLLQLTRAVQFVATFFERVRYQLVRQSNGDQANSPRAIASIFCLDIELNHQLKCHAFKNESHLKLFLGKYANFQYEPMYQFILRLYMASICAIWTKPSISSVFNFILNHRKFVGKQLTHFQANFDLGYFCRRFDVIDRFVMSKGANIVNFGPFPLHKRRAEIFTVPQVYKLTIDGRIEKSSEPVEREIKTRIISSSFDENNDALIFHAHGGAFLFGSPESHEISTAAWARKLKTIPVISIEYSLAPESIFPTALQELLDIYLFLMSGDTKVKDKLGFEPKKITLAGDSAGANMILALAIIVNDIKSQFDDTITMPISILSIYSVNLLQSAISPSRLFTAFDVILPLMLFFEVVGAYVGFRGFCDNHREIGDNNNQQKGKLTPVSHWYRCEKCLNVYDQFNEKVKIPYLSPMYYEHFDSLSGITLNIIVGEFDLFLDENITLAKQWKGKVTLDVIPDVGHGFLHFIKSSDKVTLGHDLCIKRLKQSLQRQV